MYMDDTHTDCSILGNQPIRVEFQAVYTSGNPTLSSPGNQPTCVVWTQPQAATYSELQGSVSQYRNDTVQWLPTTPGMYLSAIDKNRYMCIVHMHIYRGAQALTYNTASKVVQLVPTPLGHA